MSRAGTKSDDGDLPRLMKAMGTDDSAALFEFVELFHGEISATVRSILGSVGRRDVSRKRAEVDFLVLSAALVIFDRASTWEKGGAAPWVWTYRAIRAEVVRWLGHPRVEYIAEVHALAGQALTSRSSDVDLVALAAEHDEVAAWLADVRSVANERDQGVHLEYQMQKSLGDPSPAVTVGAQFGLKPANVRQIDARVRKRLAASR